MNKKCISHIVTLLLLLTVYITAAAQDSTTVSITNLNGHIRVAAEKAISDLLTECNQAQSNKKNLTCKGINISPEAKNSIMALWESCPFRCTNAKLTQRSIEDGNLQQIRNIPLLMIPLEGEPFGEDDYQEAVINFDNQGKIVSINLSLAPHLYSKVLKKNTSETDLRRRQFILDFVENFRTAYNRKDLILLEKVFSDDALIITGNVINVKTRDSSYNIQKVVRKKQSKVEYLNGLKRVFANNKRINVKFENINVILHPTKTDYYGVTLTQGWYADRYSDEGYLFLLIDFTNEQNPEIHVRAWDDIKVADNDRVYLSDFDI